MTKSQPTLAERIARRCCHFNGTIHDTCDAGIRYDSVQKANPDGGFFSLPCLKHRNLSGATCEKQQFPTAEEVAAEIAEDDRQVEAYRVARAAIIEAAQGKRSVSGEIACPACNDGSLRFSIAYNGHVHAKCTKEGCVSWME